MSSLAAARADGYYYPPGFDPETHGSLNRYQGIHPLGERAKNLHLGILVVRFEMPFKVSCLSCSAIVDKGVRFNAEKKRVGSYFYTPVFSFSFSCPACSHPFVITTDPKRSRYLCTQGLKQRLGDEPDEASGNPRLLQPEERDRLAADPVRAREEKLLSLRRRQLLVLQREEQRLAEEETPQQQHQRERISDERHAVAQLLQQQQADDYTANRRMRQQLQQRKRAAAAAATAAAAEEGVEVETDDAALKGIRFKKRLTRIERLASQLAKKHASIFPTQKRDFSTICKSEAVAMRLAHAAPPKKRSRKQRLQSNQQTPPPIFEC
ncbi:hypothetical protein ACSSS7_007239 [Eimeria intestinalis]